METQSTAPPARPAVFGHRVGTHVGEKQMPFSLVSESALWAEQPIAKQSEKHSTVLSQQTTFTSRDLHASTHQLRKRHLLLSFAVSLWICAWDDISARSPWMH